MDTITVGCYYRSLAVDGFIDQRRCRCRRRLSLLADARKLAIDVAATVVLGRDRRCRRWISPSTVEMGCGRTGSGLHTLTSVDCMAWIGHPMHHRRWVLVGSDVKDDGHRSDGEDVVGVVWVQQICDRGSIAGFLVGADRPICCSSKTRRTAAMTIIPNLGDGAPNQCFDDA
ncbi:hypothetical protein ACLOJK_040919, partial [Asimina triloba]